MRCTRFVDGFARDDSSVFGEVASPEVYPKKSNFSPGSLQTPRLLLASTVSFSFDIMFRIVTKLSSACSDNRSQDHRHS